MSTSSKVLGKIESVRLGHGGYQDAQLGLHIRLQGPGWSTTSSDAFWDDVMVEVSTSAKWGENDRRNAYADIMRRISRLLADAKVGDINQLVGKPVEATFTGMSLQTWRLLTEVL